MHRVIIERPVMGENGREYKRTVIAEAESMQAACEELIKAGLNKAHENYSDVSFELAYSVREPSVPVLTPIDADGRDAGRIFITDDKEVLTDATPISLTSEKQTY